MNRPNLTKIILQEIKKVLKEQSDDCPIKRVTPAMRRKQRAYAPDGPGMIAVQKKLTKLGYNPGKIDGEYGPKTACAISQAQSGGYCTHHPRGAPMLGLKKEKKCVVDGILGPVTSRHLAALEQRLFTVPKDWTIKFPGFELGSCIHPESGTSLYTDSDEDLGRDGERVPLFCYFKVESKPIEKVQEQADQTLKNNIIFAYNYNKDAWFSTEIKLKELIGTHVARGAFVIYNDTPAAKRIQRIQQALEKQRDAGDPDSPENMRKTGDLSKFGEEERNFCQAVLRAIANAKVFTDGFEANMGKPANRQPTNVITDVSEQSKFLDDVQANAPDLIDVFNPVEIPGMKPGKIEAGNYLAIQASFTYAEDALDHVTNDTSESMIDQLLGFMAPKLKEIKTAARESPQKALEVGKEPVAFWLKTLERVRLVTCTNAQQPEPEPEPKPEPEKKNDSPPKPKPTPKKQGLIANFDAQTGKNLVGAQGLKLAGTLVFFGNDGDSARLVVGNQRFRLDGKNPITNDPSEVKLASVVKGSDSISITLSTVLGPKEIVMREKEMQDLLNVVQRGGGEVTKDGDTLIVTKL